MRLSSVKVPLNPLWVAAQQAVSVFSILFIAETIADTSKISVTEIDEPIKSCNNKELVRFSVVRVALNPATSVV